MAYLIVVSQPVKPKLQYFFCTDEEQAKKVWFKETFSYTRSAPWLKGEDDLVDEDHPTMLGMPGFDAVETVASSDRQFEDCCAGTIVSGATDSEGESILQWCVPGEYYRFERGDDEWLVVRSHKVKANDKESAIEEIKS